MADKLRFAFMTLVLLSYPQAASTQEMLCTVQGSRVITSEVMSMLVTSNRPTTGKTSLRVWTFADGKCELEAERELTLLSGLAYHEPTRKIMAGDKHRVLSFTQDLMPVGEPVTDGNLDEISAIYCSPDAKFIFVGSSRAERLKPLAGRVTCLDSNTGKRVCQWDFSRPVICLAYSPDGAHLAIGMTSGAIEVIQVKSGVISRTLDDSRSGVRAVCFLPNGNQLVSLQGDGAIVMWDLDKGESRYRILPEDRFATKVAVGSQHFIASLDSDSQVTLWQAATGKQITRLKHKAVRSLIFHPDGKTLFVLSSESDLSAISLRDFEHGKKE
jgi:WD40 repeat protein